MTEKSHDHRHPRFDLVGEVERITYADDGSGYTIARIRPVGYRNSVTVVGNLMDPTPGTTLKMRGTWTDHPKFGRQFKAVHVEIRQPVTLEGIEKYLGSGLIKGIGPDMARRIVHHFKEKTLHVIQHQPERLIEISGIGEKRLGGIRKAWRKQQEFREAMLFLQSHGVSPAFVYKIFRHYGHRTIDVVRKNPYQLASDVFGIGFLMADAIAEKLGFANQAPLRLKAGILYVLHQLTEKGHVYYRYEKLIAKSGSILNSSRDAIVSAIGALSADNRIVMESLDEEREKTRLNHYAVYLPQHHRCETFVAKRLHLLVKASGFQSKVDIRQAVQWVQKQLKIELAGSQQKALAMAMTSKVLVITGGPGTGKTTIIRSITHLYEHLGARVLLAAPTGRAAKRLSETTGRSAKTLHRLLEYNPHQGGFQRDQHHPLDGDLLVVDEASMIDLLLMAHLLKAVPVTTTFILVGDVNQLPSVGPGNVLKEVLESGAVAKITLTQIFRQARNSRIVVNAHRINNGKMPALEPPPVETLGDFYFVAQETPEKILSTILTLVSDRIPSRFGFDAVEDIQVLTPMHRGIVGAENLNRQLQQNLNAQDAHVSRGEQRFGLEDKVMQVRNNYEKQVFNGDIGRIIHIDAPAKKVLIRFDERQVPYEFDEMDELVLAYAISVHKSQGSEYPAVVIPVATQHYLLLQRNLLYTGITRAKQLVVLVGTKQAVAMAVRNSTPQLRHTRLAHRLKAGLG